MVHYLFVLRRSADCTVDAATMDYGIGISLLTKSSFLSQCDNTFKGVYLPKHKSLRFLQILSEGLVRGQYNKFLQNSYDSHDKFKDFCSKDERNII